MKGKKMKIIYNIQTGNFLDNSFHSVLGMGFVILTLFLLSLHLNLFTFVTKKKKILTETYISNCIFVTTKMYFYFVTEV